ncbi:MAG: RluA family pseudouridine synthase [Gemmatimonadota bacterium]
MSGARESRTAEPEGSGREAAPAAHGESPRAERIRVTEPAHDRLDRFLADRLCLSRTRVAGLIAAGAVRVNGQPARKSYVPEAGDLIEASVPVARPFSLEPEDLPVPIVYEDEHLVVVDKPWGMVVHPGPGHAAGTLVNALLHRVGTLSDVGAPYRPGIVHRLDKDTSGLMVVARHDAAHLSLARAIARRRMRRGYVAASWGSLGVPERTVELPVGRDPRDRKKMAVVEGGRPAVTHLRVLERWRSAELLALRLETGRTHQIRVHLRALGHPIVCDPIYAPDWQRGFLGAGERWARELARRSGRLFLHAAYLSFLHPVTGRRLSFRAELPEPLASAVEWARASS